MKIICARCKNVIGEQRPYKDSSEIKATCTACIEKAKEDAAKYRAESEVKDGKEIALGNGLKGTLWAIKSEEEKLSFGEMAVAGKRFHCFKSERIKFQDYLRGLTGEEADISFLHSMSIKIDTPLKGRIKKQDLPKPEEPKKEESIQYNCTMRAPKHYVQLMFDDMAERMENITEILAEAALNAYKKEQQKVAQNGDKSPMSGSSQADIPIPK
ncbi:MAG: hypothetical protein WCT15_07005 [Candidatus Omnitrophota bacterium]